MAILRIPRSDDTSSFVLLNVDQFSSDHTLTAKIVGTDGVGAFVLQLKPALADRARANKSPCSHDEWTSILKSVLFDGITPSDIEATATAEEEVSIQLVFRKTFEGGLKQRLGSLTLKYDEDEGIELLDWCASLAVHASEQADALKKEREKVRKLIKETEELLRAKEDAEKEMLGKCLRLINSKKERIGELSERLSRYEKDVPRPEPMEVEEEVEEPPKKGRGKAAAKGKGKAKAAPVKKTTLSRRGKRPAPEPEPEEEEEEEEDTGGDGHDVEMNLDEDGVETEGEETQSDHSLEEEAPELRIRAESQSQTQTRNHKKAPPHAEEHEKPHVTTRGASHSQSKTKAETSKEDGSETESDDEL